jgi:hypothetical protein
LIKFLINIFSFKVYTISPESLKAQFKDVKRKDIEINNAFDDLDSIKYFANNIRKIEVVDKNGKKLKIENSPSLEIRFKLEDKKKYTLYFDTIFIENNILSGERSRILGLKKEIQFDKIVKIEIQNGRKHFYYKNKYYC